MPWLATTCGSQARRATLSARAGARLGLGAAARCHHAPVVDFARKAAQWSRQVRPERELSTAVRLHAACKPHYTTTPIFYVNAAPHVGHLYSLVLADVFSRWAQWRHRGWSSSGIGDNDKRETATRAVLATGTDEHGIKVQKVAEGAGEEPRALCDRVSGRFRALADKAGANVTRFIRTTDADHVAAVTHLWAQLRDRGYIYKGKHEGWYSTSDEAFYTSTQIKSSDEDQSKMISIETGSIVEWSSEDNYKFRLSAFQEPLLRWLQQNPSAVVPVSRRDILIQEIKEGLADLSVSRPRSRLHWGIPVPGDDTHTIYVWLDALTNYMTVTGYPWTAGDESHCWPSDVQVIGKDILRFHAVYFPAFLMALELPLPRHTVTHGHWTMNKSKMSKSRGNVADPFVAIDSFERDALRWLLCRIGGNISSDADWSEPIMAEYHRKYLQGQLGNLVSRVMGPKMLASLLDHAKRAQVAREANEANVVLLPRPLLAGQDIDDALESKLLACAPAFSAHMDRFELHRALDAVEDLLAACNKMLQTYEPWRIKAASQDAAQTNATDSLAAYDSIWRPLYLAMETCRVCALLLQPIMPDKMQQLLEMLHVSKGDDVGHSFTWTDACHLRREVALPQKPGKVMPLFPRLEHVT